MNTLRGISGVVIRPKTDVEALAESIERHAREGGVAPWAVAQVLHQLKPYHWHAFARDAHIPSPSPETIAAAVQLYRERIGYIRTGQTPLPFAAPR